MLPRSSPSCVKRSAKLSRDPRYPRAASRDDRQRRLRMHHQHPARETFRSRQSPSGTARTEATGASKERLHYDHGQTADPGADHRLAGVATVTAGRPDVTGASAQRGLSEAVVRDISAKKSEPEWTLRAAAEGPVHLRAEADAELGLRHRWDPFRQHQVLRAVQREAGCDVGRPARGHQEHLRQARYPEAEKQRLVSVWPRSTSQRWFTTRSAKTLRHKGSSSLTPIPRCRNSRKSSRSTSAP